MNAPKCSPSDSIDFLVASPRVVRGTEAARAQPDQATPPAHDAFTRLLHRREPDPATLWAAAAPQVRRGAGVLVLDDSTLDKPHARQLGLLTRHWSGKHRRVVQGSNLLTLLWTDGAALLLCDYRLYAKAVDQLSKNDHFRTLLATAQDRGFAPEGVVFDGWYASPEKLQAIRGHGWRWVTQLKAKRTVDPGGGNRPLGACAISERGTRVHLQGYGFVLAFLIVLPDGDKEYWATRDLTMGELTRRKYAAFAWGLAVDHRGLKQRCGVERAEVRAARAQRNHINCARRAFLRLAQHRLVTGISWWAAKTAIIREALRLYLAQPRHTLAATTEATA